MEEMSVGFERVRVVEEAEEAARRAEEEKERKRLEEIATAEAEAAAAAAAAMADGEEPRRSLRRKPGPPKPVCTRCQLLIMCSRKELNTGKYHNKARG